MTGTRAISTLTAAFADPLPAVRDAHAQGRPAVGISWPTVPVELIRAAGAVPVVLRDDGEAIGSSDGVLESGVFPRRIRRLITRALNGDLANLRQLILPRTSEQDYKAYLYLEEFSRVITPRPPLPDMRLFDRLLSSSPDAAAYTMDRTRALAQSLEELCGQEITVEGVERAIEDSNAARAATRALLALRRGMPRVSGTAVFPLLGAYWHLDPQVYAPLAETAATWLAAQPALTGPRVLVAGTPVETDELHAALEAAGGVVVAEDSPWGTRVPARSIATGGDGIAALVAAYDAEVCASREPLAQAHRWFEDAVSNVDGVVFQFAPEDSVCGWDYPEHMRHLATLGVPSVALTREAGTPFGPGERSTIADLVRRAGAYQEQNRRG